MKKVILLLLTLTLILGTFASCQKRYLYIDDETSGSPSKDTTTEREETTEDIEDIDITEETTSEENESVSAITTVISEDTLDLTSDTQGLANMPEEKEYTYTVEKIDGNYYLVFNDYVKTTYPTSIHVDFEIDSLDFLKYTVPSGNMNTGAKQHVMNYIDDSDPEHKVKIYDIEHIWQPIIPEYLPAVAYSSIIWEVYRYTFSIYFESRMEGLTYYALVLTEDDYIFTYNSLQEDYELDGYSRKELRDGDKEITVFELEYGEYFYHSILITNGEYYGFINVKLRQKLTDAELLQLGFEEYLG